MARCPGCGNPIRLGGDVKLGALITCPECHWLLEVTSLNPPELKYALRDEGWEEWEDEEEEVET
jgi:lysine biosynthesis protein LysW